MAEGLWYHYVAVVGTNFNTGYLNGQLMTDRHYNFGNTSTQQFLADAMAHDALWIGKGHWDTNDMFFKGAIDEVKIFDHALIQEEIDLLYAEGNMVSVIEKRVKNKSDVHIYPNPNKGMINLDISGGSNPSISFVVYNESGKLVYQLEASELKTINIIDLSGLPIGIYFYTLKDALGVMGSDKLILK